MTAQLFHSNLPSVSTMSCSKQEEVSWITHTTRTHTHARARAHGSAPYRQRVPGVADQQEGVVDGVADRRRAAAQLGGPSILIVVVGQSPVPDHCRHVRKRPLRKTAAVKHARTSAAVTLTDSRGLPGGSGKRT